MVTKSKVFHFDPALAEEFENYAHSIGKSQVRVLHIALREFLDAKKKPAFEPALDDANQLPLMPDSELDEGGCPGPFGMKIVTNPAIPEGSALMTTGSEPERNVVIKNTSAEVENPFD
jgi:hypothetical protein